MPNSVFKSVIGYFTSVIPCVSVLYLIDGKSKEFLWQNPKDGWLESIV